MPPMVAPKKEKIVFDEDALVERPKKPKKKAKTKQSNTPKPVRDPKKKHRATRTPHKAATKAGRGTRIAQDVRAGNRKPPPVPPGKTLKEIQAMDPDDDDFKHKGEGRPRKTEDDRSKNIETGELTWTEAIRAASQDRAQGRRARVRKYEAEIVVATQEYGVHGATKDGVKMDAEDILVQEQIVTLDEWDNEELARGYKRDRYGDFKAPPKYIPRQVQMEAFKRLIGRGNQNMKEAYIEVLEKMIEMATDDDIPAKVRLDAQREILDRLVGKVPEHLKVQSDAPWQDFLVDAIDPIELIERTTTNIRRLKTSGELEDGEELSDHLSAAGDDRPSALPSPSSSIETTATPVKRKSKYKVENPPPDSMMEVTEEM